MLGRLEVLFDAQGCKFALECWVVEAIGFPLEMILGNDWMAKFQIGWSGVHGLFDLKIDRVDAKKVRDIADTYVVE